MVFYVEMFIQILTMQLEVRIVTLEELKVSDKNEGIKSLEFTIVVHEKKIFRMMVQTPGHLSRKLNMKNTS